MLSTEVREEPSMEDILDGVRRILAAEESARLARGAESAQPEPFLLTDMIAADGTVVSITPESKAYAAIRPMAMDVIAAPSAPLPKRYTERRTLAKVEPCAIDTPRTESLSDAKTPADPSSYIERMLAHQMASAHETAMMLSNAAMEKMRAGAVDEEAVRLADSAARMMEAYDAALAKLMSLGGEAARSVRRRAALTGEPRRAGARLPKQTKRRAKSLAGQPVHH